MTDQTVKQKVPPLERDLSLRFLSVQLQPTFRFEQS